VVTRRAIVGTAGHVDHGKTTLVQALTGIDCDRLAEEKARGITIDLGFAWLVDGDLQLGFVDVPGHERFVHNALAGFGGVGIALLVVAADEGVRAQTREHVAILDLLGVRAGLVALTRSDLVEAELLPTVTAEVTELLRGTSLEAAAVVPVSAVTGAGLETLRASLVALGRLHAVEAAGRPARLAIDRAFQVPGRGAVITGTLVGGKIEVGDELVLVPSGEPVRVRSLQVHGENRSPAVAGERVAVLVAGPELADLRRGEVLVATKSLGTARSLVARVRWLRDAPAALAGWRDAQLHVGTAEVACRIRALEPAELEPGERGLVEIRTAVAVAVGRGDRIIVRRPSPPATLAGGVVLDPDWHPRRGAMRTRALVALDRDDSAAILWADEAGPAGLTAADLGVRCGVESIEAGRRLESLVGEGRLVRLPVAPARYVAVSAWKRLASRAERVLAEYFAANRLAEAMPRAEFVQRFLGRDDAAATSLVTLLGRQGLLTIDGDRVRPPGRKAATTRDEDRLVHRTLLAMQEGGITAPGPGTLANNLAAKPAILEGILRLLVERGEVVRLRDGLMTSTKAVDELIAALRATGWTTFSIPEFKDRFGLTRKWAVPLLEYLDKRRITRRVGDNRELLPAPAKPRPDKESA
jgi:selenocysteine-specific elongation factor